MSDDVAAMPEIRTTRGVAIVLCVAAVLSIAIGTLGGSQLEKLLDSGTLATVVIAIWCVVGAVAAIAAVIDAYIKPEGERLGLAIAVAATIFAILGLAVISGVVAGAANLGGSELEQTQGRRGNS